MTKSGSGRPALQDCQAQVTWRLKPYGLDQPCTHSLRAASFMMGTFEVEAKTLTQHDKNSKRVVLRARLILQLSPKPVALFGTRPLASLITQVWQANASLDHPRNGAGPTLQTQRSLVMD